MAPPRFAVSTANKFVKRARQVFKSAVREKLCESNPFLGVKGGSEVNDERKQFIERGLIDKAIAHAPDIEWAVIIALSRYGGLRTPSEMLRLRWGDIDWESGTFRVTSPKTKKQGKPFRIVPIFPELQKPLSDAFELAPEGTEFVIRRYRDTNANLRTQFQRILTKAGVAPWPRLFQNLRASRETELANEFPIHVVTEWLGNKPRVAAKHYL